MKNLTEMNINEIKKALLELFDEDSVEEMLDLYSIEELADIIEKEKESIIDTDTKPIEKHTPSRKKKANRVKKETTTYKKDKEKKWIEQRRTKVGKEDVTNRSYINKASKGYNKLQPHVKPKAKNDSKK